LIAAFGLARRTGAAALTVFLAEVRIKHPSADTAGALTASSWHPSNPLYKERIQEIQTGCRRKEDSFNLSAEKKEKATTGSPLT